MHGNAAKRAGIRMMFNVAFGIVQSALDSSRLDNSGSVVVSEYVSKRL
jgi:hypothetical protein